MSLRDQILESYSRLGNKSAVARELNINRTTVYSHLDAAGADTPIAAGRLHYMEPNVLPLPEEGVKRYLVTCAQNNTHINQKFWDNLVAYSTFIDAEIMVARFTYNKASYSSGKSVKPGRGPTLGDKADAWWDPELAPYICDDPERHGSCRYRLAPGLLFAAEMNILPTAARPLSGLETYTGRESAIFPHAKIALESGASAQGEPTKFNYTTGCVTKRNYIQKKTGLKAEFHHAYGALIVEVRPNGSWWVRQLNADGKGRFYDIPRLSDATGVLVADGEVHKVDEVEAVNWGDVHASEIEDETIELNWGEGGILDQLKPRYQFMHDIFSFRSRSHHEMKSFGRMYYKHVFGEASVEEELQVTANVAIKADRHFTQMVVVNSNHDRHGERWLDEADYRADPLNAELFLEAQLSRIRAIRTKESWDFHTWGMRRAGVGDDVLFLEKDQSFVICKKGSGTGIECGMHGDLGPNGSRGTTNNLTKVGRRINKGHDHKATIMDGVYSAGACGLNFPYMSGPTSHSISHIVTYPNGKRAIMTVWDGDFRA